ncbi:MAG: hypothetical protein JOY77_10170 [Alphaproteobacteria bacterium]|nr:hypothetical protein [Alphaproteobacteria bacterium]
MSTNGAVGMEPQDVARSEKKRGGQPGNLNRFKTGHHSVRNRATRSQVHALKRAVRETLMLAEAALKARAR